MTTEPGSYAVDRSFNPDPSLSERERAAGHAEAGELPGGGFYAGERLAVLLSFFVCKVTP